MQIASVLPAGRAECTCIYVGHPMHLFITKDFLVTHNTFFASKARKPFFIATEDGVGGLDYDRSPLCKEFKDIMGWLTFLYTAEHDFKTVVVDSLDWAEKLVHEFVRADKGENIFAEYGKGFNFSLTHFERMIKGLDALRDKKDMTVILLAHSKIKKFEPPDMDPYDRYMLDLHEKAAALFIEWADIVGFACLKSFTQSADGGFGKTIVRATSTGERILRTEQRPSHDGKNRYSLPYEIPLKWPELAKLVAAALKEKVVAEVAPEQKTQEVKEEVISVTTTVEETQQNG